MSMNKKIFEILACPLCKSKVFLTEKKDELICKPCGLAFPLVDEIPVMLESEARNITTDERL